MVKRLRKQDLSQLMPRRGKLVFDLALRRQVGHLELVQLTREQEGPGD
jgi:hypothetical protein